MCHALKSLVISVAVLCGVGTVGAEVEGSAAPKFIGVLDISERYSQFGGWAESDLYLKAPPLPFTVSQSEPESGGQDVEAKTLELVPTDFDLIETSYEFKQVAVSSKIDDWVQVRINDELAWIQMHPGEEFSPYLSLIEGLWGYTFSTRLDVSRVPGGEGRVVEVTPEMQNEANAHPQWSPHVEILESVSLSEVVGESDWIKIQVFDQPPCERYDEPRQVILEGWIPAYDADGEISVWYYSRGC